MPTPIYDSITRVRFSIVAALTARTARAVYWLEAPSNAVRPFLVAQSQDLGGRAERAIGTLDWSGLIVVKAIADTLGAAEQLMVSVAPGMDALATITGYNISALYDHPVVIPPDGGLWQSAHQWRVSLHRS
jgi:hypothetical protein